MGTSYNDFFLFDDTLALSNYKSRLIKDYPKYIQWNESQVKTVKDIWTISLITTLR